MIPNIIIFVLAMINIIFWCNQNTNFKWLQYFNLVVLVIDVILITLVSAFKIIMKYHITDVSVEITITLLITYLVNCIILMRTTIKQDDNQINLGKFKLIKVSGLIAIPIIIWSAILIQIK